MIPLPEDPCALCRKREATQLCDFVTRYYWTSTEGCTTGTCDLPMCLECAHSIGAHDFCPEHHERLPDLEIKDSVLLKRKTEYEKKMLQDFWKIN